MNAPEIPLANSRRTGFKWSPKSVAALSFINIIFSCALSGVVATQLDYQSKAPYCYLNVKGQVCVFTYVTTGATLFITLAILIPVFLYNIRKSFPLHDVYLPLQLFLFFWQLVMSITISIRGGQATDSNLPAQTARNSAIAFAWLMTSASFFICLIVAADLYDQRKHALRVLDSNAKLLDRSNEGFMKKHDVESGDVSSNVVAA